MTRLTPQQRLALNVLDVAERQNRLVGISTYTSQPDEAWLRVHTRVASGLCDLGLATRNGACLTLTAKGRQQVENR
jgi:hypothetical protein